MESVSHIWERLHFKWIVAGAFSAILAGTVTLLLSMYFTVKGGVEWSHPLKLIGATVYGPEATAYGPLGKAGIVGGIIHYSLCVLYGVVFAHLVHEDSRRRSVMILALITSFIIWIFGFLLFMPSFNLSLSTALSTPVGLFLHLAFGFSFAVFLCGLRPLVIR